MIMALVTYSSIKCIPNPVASNYVVINFASQTCKFGRLDRKTLPLMHMELLGTLV